MRERFIDTIKFLPLLIFMIIARSGGMTDVAWKNAFILGGLCTILVVALQLYKNIILDRLMLGINLFLLIGAVTFFCNAWSILYYFAMYKGPVFLSCIFLVGLITTFFSRAGFVGVDSNQDQKTYHTSLLLLVVNVLCIIWSIVTNAYGLIVSIVVPFVVLRIIYEQYKKQFHGK